MSLSNNTGLNTIVHPPRQPPRQPLVRSQDDQPMCTLDTLKSLKKPSNNKIKLRKHPSSKQSTSSSKLEATSIDSCITATCNKTPNISSKAATVSTSKTTKAKKPGKDPVSGDSQLTTAPINTSDVVSCNNNSTHSLMDQTTISSNDIPMQSPLVPTIASHTSPSQAEPNTRANMPTQYLPRNIPVPPTSTGNVRTTSGRNLPASNYFTSHSCNLPTVYQSQISFADYQRFHEQDNDVMEYNAHNFNEQYVNDHYEGEYQYNHQPTNNNNQPPTYEPTSQEYNLPFHNQNDYNPALDPDNQRFLHSSIYSPINPFTADYTHLSEVNNGAHNDCCPIVNNCNARGTVPINSVVPPQYIAGYTRSTPQNPNNIYPSVNCTGSNAPVAQAHLVNHQHPITLTTGSYRPRPIPAATPFPACSSNLASTTQTPVSAPSVAEPIPEPPAPLVDGVDVYYICPICGEKLLSQNAFDHMQDHYRLECPMCQRVLPTQDIYARHLQAHF